MLEDSHRPAPRFKNTPPISRAWRLIRFVGGEPRADGGSRGSSIVNLSRSDQPFVVGLLGPSVGSPGR